jgi:glycolate oxidase
LFDGRTEGSLEKAELLAGEVLRMCVDLGGSITGEHGIGVEKRDFLPIMFSAVDIDTMYAIRLNIDPKGLSNQGKMFPAGESTKLLSQKYHPLEVAGVISRE